MRVHMRVRVRLYEKSGCEGTGEIERKGEKERDSRRGQRRRYGGSER